MPVSFISLETVEGAQAKIDAALGIGGGGTSTTGILPDTANPGLYVIESLTNPIVGPTGPAGPAGPVGPQGLPGQTVGIDNTLLRVIETVTVKANTTGGTYTLPTRPVTVHDITLTTATSVITLPAAVAGASMSVFLAQGTGGSKAISWAALAGEGIVGQGSPAILSTIAGKIDLISFVCRTTGTWIALAPALDVTA